MLQLHTMSAAFTATICEDIYDVHGDNSALIAAHGTELKDVSVSYVAKLLLGRSDIRYSSLPL